MLRPRAACGAAASSWSSPAVATPEVVWAICPQGLDYAVETSGISTHGGRRQRWTPKLTGLGQEVLVEGFTTGRYTLGEDP